MKWSAVLLCVLWMLSSFARGETLVTAAKILEVTPRGFILMVGTQPLAVEDTPDTLWWFRMASGKRGDFKVDDSVHVRIKTDSDPPVVREMADPETWKWLDAIRKTPKKGTIESMDAKYVSIKFDDGTKFRYRITDKSDVMIGGKEGSLIDLKAGMSVWVRGRLLPTLDTWVMEISDTEPPKKETKPAKTTKTETDTRKPIALTGILTGKITATLPKFKMIDVDVKGRLFHITTDSATQFFYKGKEAIAPTIKLGMTATVTYKRDKTGRIFAVKMELFD